MKCGTTHYHGCACHEAARDAEIEKLKAERDEGAAARKDMRIWRAMKEENAQLRSAVVALGKALEFYANAVPPGWAPFLFTHRDGAKAREALAAHAEIIERARKQE